MFFSMRLYILIIVSLWPNVSVYCSDIVESERPYIIAHPKANIAISQKTRDLFHLLQPKGEFKQEPIRLAEYKPQNIVRCFHAIQGYVPDMVTDADVEEIYTLADSLSLNNKKTMSAIYSTFIRNGIENNDPEILYSAIQGLMKHGEVTGQEACTLLIKQMNNQEQEERLADFLYEKMFDDPLFKTDAIRDYEEDLNTWSTTNSAYMLYAALIKAQGKKSCDVLKNGSFLEHKDSWHDMYKLLHNTEEKLDRCIRPYGSSEYLYTIDSRAKVQRTYLPLIAQCASTLMSRGIIGALSTIYYESDQSSIRKLFFADIQALHAPCFGYKNDPPDIMLDLIRPCKDFTIELSLSDHAELLVEDLSRLPMHLTLKLLTKPKNIDKEHYIEEKRPSKIIVRHYIFPPWWRIKTIVSLAGCCVLAGFFANSVMKSCDTIDKLYKTQMETTFTNVTAEERNVIRLMPITNHTLQNVIHENIQDPVLAPGILISPDIIKQASTVVHELHSIEKDRNIALANQGEQAMITIVLGFINHLAYCGSRFIQNLLGLFSPHRFAVAACTIEWPATSAS
jgi:hypothetical protein